MDAHRAALFIRAATLLICCQQVPEGLHEGSKARLPGCKQGTGRSGPGQSGVELGRTISTGD